MEAVKEFFRQIWEIQILRFLLWAVLNLALAAFLGGFIGFQREQSHHLPAGFRTHILVCVGAALAMLTSIYLARTTDMRIDVSRISSQVIAGIGFLGAGTILKEGFSVRGLTTAASLWAVACIGTAVGSGYYAGAVVATVFIYITLNSLKKVDIRKKAGNVLYVEVKNLAEQVPQLSRLIRRSGAVINSMEIIGDSSSDFLKKSGTSVIKAQIYPKDGDSFNALVAVIRADENFVDVHAE